MVEIEITTLTIFTRYVDDVFVAVVWEKLLGQDLAELEAVVIEKMRVMADRVLAMLNFTCDKPGESWMPCLEVQLRSKNQQIEFKHFSKPCANSFVIGERSAMSARDQRTVLIQEGLRRRLNTSAALPSEVWQQIIEDFAVRMYRSGYKSRMRSQAIHGALAAYVHRVRLNQEGSRPLYRARTYQMEEREQAKLAKKGSWFQGTSKKLESVLFVTATPHSQLSNSINNRLNQADIPVKVAEMSGTQISRLLVIY